MTKREQLLLLAGQATLDWYEDTGDCHFCALDGQSRLGGHESHCPLAALAKFDGVKKAKEST